MKLLVLMKTTAIQLKSINSIDTIFDFLKVSIQHRLTVELLQQEAHPPHLTLEFNQSHLAVFFKENQFSHIEIIALLLALIPHISPNFLNEIITEFLPNGGEFPEFGGVKGKNHRGILPTGETLLYIINGTCLDERLRTLEYLYSQSKLFKEKILYIESVPKGEPAMSGKLQIDEEYVAKLTTGTIVKPQLSQEFPASLIETQLNWEDLVLNEKTMNQIKEIETWLQYHSILMNDWNMKHKIKPGYRVMFYGPPGTGKTLTAGLLGKYTNKDVYRIDLSLVVSKYIGETEKNLSSLFDKAINKNWILFFDEADAVFGKRTSVRDAHDKYANQEVSYLLQRIEAHPGLVILASNFKSNIDVAFTRRFQTIIEFEIPSYNERLRLWKNTLPKNIGLQTSVSLELLAKKYAMTGANIINVVQYACLKTIAKNSKAIQNSFLIEGIKKEYLKEGRTVS